jgi:hypothetical protein
MVNKRSNFVFMDFIAYTAEFDRILNNATPPAPYDNPNYLHYTKLNASRMRRWLKKGVLSEELRTAIAGVQIAQKWIVITEPWCGDASHIIPFIQMAAEQNPMISIDYELRDTEPFCINDYLTRGGKAIPKLIIRDEAGNDLATWGPRPAEAQTLFYKLKESGLDYESQKTELQNWYNNDDGKAIMAELAVLLASV